jgi:peptide-methionine (S)-S-oxide reductase
MMLFRKKVEMPAPGQALPGRTAPITTAENHFVFKRPLKGPFPESSATAMFGMGCFWGAERKFWQLPGVLMTAVGYAGGETPNPTYRETCTGDTGHNEVVHVVFDPTQVSYAQLLKTFWESHDPTQANRQGNDIGTQYRSGIYCYGTVQLQVAEQSKQDYARALRAKGYAGIATEVVAAPVFYYAEAEHQQYLAKNPGGYCGLGGTGVTCQIGTGVATGAVAAE